MNDGDETRSRITHPLTGWRLGVMQAVGKGGGDPYATRVVARERAPHLAHMCARVLVRAAHDVRVVRVREHDDVAIRERERGRVDDEPRVVGFGEDEVGAPRVAARLDRMTDGSSQETARVTRDSTHFLKSAATSTAGQVRSKNTRKHIPPADGRARETHHPCLVKHTPKLHPKRLALIEPSRATTPARTT